MIESLLWIYNTNILVAIEIDQNMWTFSIFKFYCYHQYHPFAFRTENTKSQNEVSIFHFRHNLDIGGTTTVCWNESESGSSLPNIITRF